MKKLIVTTLLLMTFNTYANCFEYQGTDTSNFKSIKISNIKNKGHAALKVITKKGTFESSYYCLGKSTTIECSGDDDGGAFTVDTASKEFSLSIKYLNVGEPDSKIFEIPVGKKIQLKGKRCQ